MRRSMSTTLVLLALAAPVVHAADSLAVSPDPPPRREWRRMDAWGVTRQIALLRDLSAAPTVLAADRLLDLGARDLAEATAFVPGLSHAPADHEGARRIVRGFAPSPFASGLANAALIANLDGPIDPVSLDHLEVLRGALDPVYGALGQPGGALHRVGRMPTLEPLRAVTLAGDPEGRARGTLDVSDVIGRSRTTYRIGAAFDRLQEARSGDHAGSGWALSPVLAWPINDFTNLTVRVDHAQRARREDPGLPLDARVLDGARDVWFGAADAPEVRSAASAAGLEFTFDPEGELRLRQRLAFDRATREGADTRWLGTTLDGLVLRDQHTRDQRTRGFDAQSEAVLSFLTGGWLHQGVAGVEFAGSRLEGATSDGLVDSVTITGHPAGASPIGHVPARAWQVTSHTEAAYLADQVNLGTHWRASLGVRFARERRTLAPGTSAPATRTSVVGVSPRVGLVLLTSATTRLHAAWSASVRPNERCIAWGDPVAPERARMQQRELGWHQELRNGRLGWSATLYDIVDRDALLRPADPDAAGRFVPRRTSRGLELQANGEIATDLRVFASAAWTDARVTDPGTSGLTRDAQVPRVPVRQFALQAIRRVSEGALTGLDVGVGLTHDAARTADATGSLTLPGTTLVSAMLGFGRARWQVQVNADNLGDVRAWDADERGSLWPRAGRTVRGTLRWAF